MITKNIFLTLLLCSFINYKTKAQTSIVSGNKSIEFSGIVAGFYNYRILKPGEDNFKNNKFALRNTIFCVNGRVENKWEYEFQVDFLNMSTSISDPENPGIVSAFIAYKALPVKIKFGYDKLPFSQGSLASIYETPYWSRTQLTRGDFFSRRDAGITLSSSLWKQRVNIYAGAYSGLGETVFVANGGDTDPSGSPEFIGRVDVAFPSRYRHDEIDYKLSPIPLIRIGANARYTDKTQPGDNSLPIGVEGIYGLKVINGKKAIYGFDASIAYQGFSAQMESQLLKLNPANSNDPLYHNTTEDVNKKTIYAGGWQGQINYFWKRTKSIFSARYENYNTNDLVSGDAQRFSAAYAYQINGFKNSIKIHYFKIVTEDENLEPLKWTDQIRVGWQYMF